MGEGGNVVPKLTRDEHHEGARAKRVLMRGFSGDAYYDAKVDSEGQFYTKDLSLHSLVSLLLFEQQKTNYYLSCMVGEEVLDADVPTKENAL